MKTALCEGITWIGVVDWTVRDFHGYATDRGSSYNAYLVQSDKTAVIDAVKAPFAGDMLKKLAQLTSPENVDYVVCNHAEPDHAGGLPALMAACRNARLICNAKCRATLAMYFDTSGWDIQVIKSGDTLSLGGLTLHFMDTPMVHWPESMFTYIPERRLLFSMDAFGQHYASAHRFDDETPLDEVMAEAKTYFANIVMLYGGPISRVLEKADRMDIGILAPSHGVIWRKHMAAIMAAYHEWVTHRPIAKVLVIYDTMWKSTEKMANAIVEGALEENVQVKLQCVRTSNLTVLATEALDAAAIAVGSPTLNKTLMPGIAAALTYLKGLGPTGKAGFAFGSYGWSRGGVEEVNDYLTRMKFEILRAPLAAQFVPNDQSLQECREAGRMLASRALRSVDASGAQP